MILALNTGQTAAASQSVRCLCQRRNASNLVADTDTSQIDLLRCLCQRRNASNLTIYSGLQVRTFIHRHPRTLLIAEIVVYFV